MRFIFEKSRGVKGSWKLVWEMNGLGSRVDLVKMVRVKLWMYFMVLCIFFVVFWIILYV